MITNQGELSTLIKLFLFLHISPFPLITDYSFNSNSRFLCTTKNIKWHYSGETLGEIIEFYIDFLNITQHQLSREKTIKKAAKQSCIIMDLLDGWIGG
jgi:hypothetical protein